MKPSYASASQLENLVHNCVQEGGVGFFLVRLGRPADPAPAVSVIPPSSFYHALAWLLQLYITRPESQQLHAGDQRSRHPSTHPPAEMTAGEQEVEQPGDATERQLGGRRSTSSTTTLPGDAVEASDPSRRGDKTDLEKGGKNGGSGGKGTEGEKGAVADGAGPHKTEGGVIVVDWKGDDDPACPLNWGNGRRIGGTFAVAGFTLLAPLSSSMIAPAAGQIADKLNITNEVEISMTVSIFVLGFAFSPLVFGPASELFGRVRILQGTNLFYIIFNLVCAFAKTKGQFIAFRLIAGLGGGAPLSIGAGVLSDLWRAEERGKSAALYSLGPLLGPALGPVMGGWVAERLPNDGYRWIFFSTTIFSALVQVVGLFTLRETYGPVLLHRQALAIKREMGLPADSPLVQTVYERKAGGKRKTPKEVVMHGMFRPFVLFFHEPILQVLAIFMAIIYGVAYILIVSTTSVFQEVYGQSAGIASLHFIAMLLGYMLAAQGGARFLDVLYRRLKAKGDGRGRPEFRLPLMVPASFLLPLGLFLYGWSAEKHFHWIVADIGLFLIALAMILVFQAITTYLLDAFTLYAASALAATTCLRSLFGFGFPLFAPYMYSGIGYGWGCSVLAFVSIVVGVPAAPLLWVYGERIRQHSKFAAKHQAKP
ncbi:hypothetical protein JCM11251_000590 [Rhodosporidiobolus azoricus]